MFSANSCSLFSDVRSEDLGAFCLFLTFIVRSDFKAIDLVPDLEHFLQL